MKVDYRKLRQDGEAEFWVTEFYSDEGTVFPVGMAYILVFRSSVRLNLFFIVDAWRGRGYGSQLLRAVKERWPDCVATTPMNAVAAKLLNSVRIPTEDEVDDD